METHPVRETHRSQAAITPRAVNGLFLAADEVETAETIEAVAAGHLSEATLAKWIAARVKS